MLDNLIEDLSQPGAFDVNAEVMVDDISDSVELAKTDVEASMFD